MKTAENTINVLRSAASAPGRLTITEIARSSTWKQNISQAGIYEVTERGETCGWLLSDDYLKSLLSSIDSMEDQMEQLQVNQFIQDRIPSYKPLSGEDLKQAVHDSWQQRRSNLLKESGNDR